MPFPTGTITSVDVLIDVQGTADLSNITVNGVAAGADAGRARRRRTQCKHGGWKHFSSPTFKNQGQCVSYFNHALHASKHHK